MHDHYFRAGAPALQRLSLYDDSWQFRELYCRMDTSNISVPVSLGFGFLRVQKASLTFQSQLNLKPRDVRCTLKGGYAECAQLSPIANFVQQCKQMDRRTNPQTYRHKRNQTAAKRNKNLVKANQTKLRANKTCQRTSNDQKGISPGATLTLVSPSA